MDEKSTLDKVLTFNEMDLPDLIKNSLNELNFTIPTPIQAQAIPLALQGKDIIGSASTGTGKTFAFALPMVTHLVKNQEHSSLILCPTRELAQQVSENIRKVLGKKSGLRIALLIGGDSFVKQRMQLQNSPRIIVGTPGRIIDHFEQGTLDNNNFTFLVLDEMDRMFDMGFSGQIEQIIKQLPAERQTLMFTATLPPKITQLAAKYLKNPERISVNSHTPTALNITQETINVKDSEKYSLLLEELNKREGSVIIFVKTKYSTERLAKSLNDENHSASAIHGDLRQNKRERVMNAFRKGKARIMVATDVAARGLDVPSIQHVINYDLPHAPEDYIHRIGRTARAGASGFALNLVNGEDKRRWIAIQRLLNPGSASSSEDRSERFSSRGSRSSGGFSRSSRGGDRRESRGGSRSFDRGQSRDRKFDRGSSWSTDEGSNNESPRRSFGDRPRKPFNRDNNQEQSPRSGFGERNQYRDRKPFNRENRDSSFRPSFGKDRNNGDRFNDKPRTSFWENDEQKKSFDKPFESRRSSDKGGYGRSERKPRSDFFKRDDR